jgi:prepilin-type N-terminal cleavage/methylation domain-containing protein
MKKPNRRSKGSRGYTLVEVIVAMLVFTVGGVALAGSSAVIGRALRENDVRERASRIAASRLDIIGASCRSAASGREITVGIDSEWSVALDSSRLTALESVTYPSAGGIRTDSYRVVLGCP